CGKNKLKTKKSLKNCFFKKSPLLKSHFYRA
ncbi:MAG: hypothetical protein ACI834_001039, partial [Colwellia sp.]